MEGFKKLVENQSVTFEVGDGEKGPVAKILKLFKSEEYILTIN